MIISLFYRRHLEETNVECIRALWSLQNLARNHNYPNENWFWHVVKLILSSLVSIIVSITISSHGIGFGLAFLDLARTNLVTLLFLQAHLRVIAVCY